MKTENIQTPDGVEKDMFVDNIAQMIVKISNQNKNHIQRNMKKQYFGMLAIAAFVIRTLSIS